METPSEKPKEVRDEHVSPPVKPYKPLVPHSQRLVKARKEHKCGKFLEMLKKLTDMPSYAKFLKDLLSNKGKLLKNATVSLTEECTVIIQNKLPLSFLIQEVSPSHVRWGMLSLAEPYVILGLV